MKPSPGVPSWHHQAVRSVDGTRLAAVGVADTDGEVIIEAVERLDKTFVPGLQYHPEIAVVRGTYETSPSYFTAIVKAAENNLNQPYILKESRL